MVEKREKEETTSTNEQSSIGHFRLYEDLLPQRPMWGERGGGGDAGRERRGEGEEGRGRGLRNVGHKDDSYLLLVAKASAWQKNKRKQKKREKHQKSRKDI